MSADIPEPYLDAWRAFLNAHAASLERTEHALTAAGLPPLRAPAVDRVFWRLSHS